MVLDAKNSDNIIIIQYAKRSLTLFENAKHTKMVLKLPYIAFMRLFQQWVFILEIRLQQSKKKKNCVSHFVLRSVYTNFAEKSVTTMNKVLITAVRQTQYRDLMAKYENVIEHACNVTMGQQWISINGRRPDGLCPSAWESMQQFVEKLARGEGNFFDGWMQDPMSAMISCNDGFRPVSFYLEVLSDND